jgi:hypothetical protein
MLTPTYITGILEFSTVHMKMFILNKIIKTQRLNIKIYSDKKTVIFIAMYTLNKNQLCLKNCVIYKRVLKRQSNPATGLVAFGVLEG